MVTVYFDNHDNLCETSLSFKGVPPPLPLAEINVALAPPPDTVPPWPAIVTL